jgi:ADP-heptose:LPS heptosyltransferase
VVIYPVADKSTSAEEAWVNPIGGLGDTLRISGVLKAVIDKNHTRRFNLVRRTSYTNLLKNHPAIKTIGFPPTGARIVSTAYWLLDDVGEGINRPYQILARAFGLETPIEETLYLPGGFDADPLLQQTIPWHKKNIVFAPFSVSPRKAYNPKLWEQLAAKLSHDGHLVIQIGRASEQYIRHTYSLLGLTTPRQLISLVKKADLVVTCDSFAIYAAHLTGTPAVVLWGPTNHRHYGFPGQIHLQSPMICEKNDCCLGRDYPMNYDTECFWGMENSCVNKITVDEIYDSVNRIIY